MIPILSDIVIILAVATVVLLASHRLRIPTVLGFLIAGMVMGPHALGLVVADHDIEIMAEIGVVLLLFSIGLEVSFDDLWRMRRLALGGGFVQVLLSAAAGFGIFAVWGYTLESAVFAGFFVSLSSTAVVLKLVQDRGEADSPHGRSVLGILLFQDFIVVVMMLLIPALAGSEFGSSESVGGQLVKAAVVLALLVGSRWAVPWLLHQVVRTRNREVFALAVILICLAIAWMTQAVNLSLALGAFIAGLLISESEYSRDALSIVLPFLHIFASIFFISMGMLVDIPFAVENAGVVFSLAGGVILIKVLVAVLAVLLMRGPIRVAVLSGMALAQIGEFSFVLLQQASNFSLVDAETYQIFLAVALLTLLLTPVMFQLAPAAAAFALRRSPARFRKGRSEEPRKEDRLQDHLIVVGAGLGGRNVARAAKSCGIPYVMLEMNPETVKTLRAQGEPIFYGDAVNDLSLHACGITRARVMVVVISDPAAVRRVITQVKRMNPALHLIVRTRYIKELPALRDLGADQVIPEEFETSVEIFTRVLTVYLVPRSDIESVAAEIRSEGYHMLRAPGPSAFTVRGTEISLPDIEVSAFRVLAGGGGENATLAELDLRRRFHVTVLALRRGESTTANPPAGERLLVGDILVTMGTVAALAEFGEFLNPPDPEAPEGESLPG